MTIARFEPVQVYTLSYTTDDFGEQLETKTLKFKGMALVSSVRNSVAILERYRIYSDLLQLKFNYTNYMRDIVDNQQLYTIIHRDKEWRITDALESDDRQHVTLMCYRSDPVTKG